MKSGGGVSKVGVAAPVNRRNPNHIYFCLRMGQLSCLQGSYSNFCHCDLFLDRIKERKMKFDKRGSKLSCSNLENFSESLTQQFHFIPN